MKKLMLFCLISLSTFAFGETCPFIYIAPPSPNDSPPSINDPCPRLGIHFLSPLPTKVYYKEEVRIPVFMNFYNLWKKKNWQIPNHTFLEITPVKGDKCPPLSSNKVDLWAGICHMNLIIKGDELGVVQGSLTYRLQGSHNKYHWDLPYTSPTFSIRVIPHPLSMTNIQIQNAKVGVNFIYDFKRTVQYYNENIAAGAPIVGEISKEDKEELAKLGLEFDPNQLIVRGTPKKNGTHTIKVIIANSYSRAAPASFTVVVDFNASNTPIFKKDLSFITATANKNYSLNLSSIIESPKRDISSNQLSFRIINETKNSWLHISAQDNNILEGTPPPEDAGTIAPVTIVAHSNTGGDSKPITLQIPVAQDPKQRPTITYFEMSGSAGNNFNINLKPFISSPIENEEIELFLKDVTPSAPWLHVSTTNPMELEGMIPTNLVGEKYLITLIASNEIGGMSDPITVPLQININPLLTPQFKNENPVLPLVYLGQSYFHDFVENHDVYPEYEDLPYEVSFAEDFERPDWLHLENNQLYADEVPTTLDQSRLAIRVRIKNKPGGFSGDVTLHLNVMK